MKILLSILISSVTLLGAQIVFANDPSSSAPFLKHLNSKNMVAKACPNGWKPVRIASTFKCKRK